jgi:hypothetical protein
MPNLDQLLDLLADRLLDRILKHLETSEQVNDESPLVEPPIVANQSFDVDAILSELDATGCPDNIPDEVWESFAPPSATAHVDADAIHKQNFDNDFEEYDNPSWFTRGGSECDLCGGTVINARCTNCMFDWDD